MSIIAKLAAAAVLAGAVTGFAAPAHATIGDPQPTVQHCHFTFKSLKAVNLWDDGDSDFVIFQAKGENFPGGGRPVKFFLGTEHTAAAFNYPTATATTVVRSFGLNVLLDEPFPAANRDVPPVRQPLCGDPAGTNFTLRFTNGDAEYLLTYDLSAPHI
jgi:hypothetical protein